MKVWKLWAGASLLGVGALAIACSSSSSGGGGGGGDDAGDAAATDDGGDGGGTPCTAMTGNAATVDGGSGWGCLETNCNTELTACAANCLCNNAILNGLGCVAEAGLTDPLAQANKLTSCLTATISPIISETPVTPLVTCLQGKGKTACAPAGYEGGTGEGGSGDAGDGGGSTTGDAGDGGSTGDGGGSDAGASDAPAG
jgi:hypothetical protein